MAYVDLAKTDSAEEISTLRALIHERDEQLEIQRLQLAAITSQINHLHTDRQAGCSYHEEVAPLYEGQGFRLTLTQTRFDQDDGLNEIPLRIRVTNTATSESCVIFEFRDDGLPVVLTYMYIPDTVLRELSRIHCLIS